MYYKIQTTMNHFVLSRKQNYRQNAKKHFFYIKCDKIQTALKYGEIFIK